MVYAPWSPIDVTDCIRVEEIPQHPGVDTLVTSFRVFALNRGAVDITARIHTCMIARVHGFLKGGDSAADPD